MNEYHVKQKENFPLLMFVHVKQGPVETYSMHHTSTGACADRQVIIARYLAVSTSILFELPAFNKRGVQSKILIFILFKY